MAGRCPECGAPLGDGESCEDLFNRMLALEWQAINEGAVTASGLDAHFFAVSTYQLQHPDRLEVGVVIGLAESLKDVLQGRRRRVDVRASAASAFAGPARVRRRAPGRDQELGTWPSQWPRTVADCCDVPPNAYAAAVRDWAEATVRTIARARSGN